LFFNSAVLIKRTDKVGTGRPRDRYKSQIFCVTIEPLFEAMLKHRGKEKIKVSYEVVIRKAVNLEKSLFGSTIYIEWKR
jgi:hypothetical protein